MIEAWFHLIPGGYILYKAHLKKEDILITSPQRKESGVCQQQTTSHLGTGPSACIYGAGRQV